MEEQIKCFPDKVKFKEFTITKPLLYEMLKDLGTNNFIGRNDLLCFHLKN